MITLRIAWAFVAVKKLVVGFWLRGRGRPFGLHRGYFEKIRVFKAGLRLNILAWNNTIGLLSYLVGLWMGVMIKRNSWGHSYFIVRGEILGFL
ncbi:unnamed protein product [Bathycoccus prasinos]